MSFSSITFFVFFAIVIICIAITNISFLQNRCNVLKIRKIMLLTFSFVFYAWWDWRFCGLMLLVITITYLINELISQYKEKQQMFLSIGIACELTILCIFKYFGFFLDTFKALFGLENSININIILPVGISFYIFQAISFMVDAYRQQVSKSSLINTALYIAFFPQLVAGPIVKAREFLPQLEEKRTVTFKNLEIGLQIFIIGLFKKIVIADHLSVFVDDVYSKPIAFDSFTVLLAVVAYSIQIYCDFSGYSDMAIGCARCLGYELNRNFNLPYLAANVSEFWKRWHISLSSWLMEYLYIPLGGNRKGKIRQYINLLITMILGGLWHGASWNFVLWGTMHGLMLCIHKIWTSINGKTSTSKWKKFIAILFTYAWVSFCWIFFRNENVINALVIIKCIFIWDNSGIRQIFSWIIIAIFFILFQTCYAWKKSEKGKMEEKYVILDLTKTFHLFIWFVMIGVVLGMAYTGDNPFIYFQF